MRRHNLNLINRVKGENKSVRDRIGPIPSVKGITREIILASFSCPLIYIIPLYFITQLPPLSPSKLVYPPPLPPQPNVDVNVRSPSSIHLTMLLAG